MAEAWTRTVAGAPVKDFFLVLMFLFVVVAAPLASACHARFPAFELFVPLFHHAAVLFKVLGTRGGQHGHRGGLRSERRPVRDAEPRTRGQPAAVDRGAAGEAGGAAQLLAGRVPEPRATGGGPRMRSLVAGTVGARARLLGLGVLPYAFS